MSPQALLFRTHIGNRGIFLTIKHGDVNAKKMKRIIMPTDWIDIMAIASPM